MADEYTNKVKSKRKHAYEVPYKRNKSLLGRVGETVKDMLSPSWLVDLVKTVKKSPTKVDASVDQQQKEEINNAHKVLNYMPMPVSNTNPQYGSVGVTNTPYPMSNTMNNTGSPVQQQAHNTQSYQPPVPQQPMNPARMVPGFPSPQMTPIAYNGEDVTFQGTSSWTTPMVQPRLGTFNDVSHMRQTTGISDNAANATELHRNDTSNKGSNSYLWSSPKRSSPQASASKKSIIKPMFNITAFNNTNNQSVMNGDNSQQQSPFYEGRTSYGGASSIQKKKAGTPYQVMPNRRQAKIKSTSNSNLTGVTSSHARRILDNLERMASPLSDAKKIPDYAAESSLALTPASYRTSQVRRHSLQGPPTKKVSTPVVAKIAMNRSALIDESMKVSSQESNNETSQQAAPSSYTLPIATSTGVSSYETNSKSSGKMRAAKGSMHYSKRQEQDDEEVEIPDLPTGFTLPVTNMPTFSFNVGGSSGAKPKVPSTVPTKPFQSPVDKSTSASCQSDSDFTFSSPLQTKHNGRPCGSPINMLYEFSKPLSVDSTSPATAIKQTNPTMSFGSGSFTLKTTTREKRPVVTRENEYSGGFEPAPPTKMGSVADILGGASKKEPNNNRATSTTPTMSFKSGKSSTPTVLKTGSVLDVLGSGSGGVKSGSVLDVLGSGSGGIKSGNVLDVLESGSGGVKSGSVTDVLDKKTTKIGIFSKQSTNTWECPTCMINNKSDISKCVACHTAKAVSKSANSIEPLTKPTNVGSKWECSTCLVQNESSATQCVACTTAKPGPVIKKATTVKSSKWECSTCLVQNESSATQCVACTTAKPGPPDTKSATSGGMWECPTCMIQSKNDVKKCPACLTDQPGAKKSPAKVVSRSTSWDCETCFVNNKSTSSVCIACEGPRPGAHVEKPAFTNTPAFTTSFAFKDQEPKQGGFSIPASSDSSSSMGSALKFGGAMSDLKFGGSLSTTSSNDNSKSEIKSDSTEKPASGASGFGGVTFGTGTGGFGGVKFGNTNASEKTESVTVPSVVSDNKVTTSPPSGASSTAPTFNFGKPVSNTVTVSSTSSEPSTTATGIFSGISLGNPAVSTVTAPKPSATTISTSAADSKPSFVFGLTPSSGVSNFNSPLGVVAPNTGFTPSALASSSVAPVVTAVVSATASAPTFNFSAGAVSSSAAAAGPVTALGMTNTSGATGTTSLTTMGASSGFQFNAKPDTTATAPSTGGFSFGSSSATPTSVSGLFGGVAAAKATSADKPAVAAAPSFNFTAAATGSPSRKRSSNDDGASAAKKGTLFSSTQSTTSSTTFAFGAANPAANATNNAAAAPNAPAATTFTFGGSNTPTPPPAFGGFDSKPQDSPQAVPNLFGSTPATTAGGSVFGGNAPAFGTTSNGSQAPAFGSVAPTFSGADATNKPSVPPTANAGIFAFGAASNPPPFQASVPPAPSTGFNFNTPASNPAPLGGAPGGGFNFAANTAPANNTAGNGPVFNFSGGSQPANPAAPANPPGVFAFGATSQGAAPVPNNPFNAAAGAQPAAGRKIKRAVRKIRK